MRVDDPSRFLTIQFTNNMKFHYNEMTKNDWKRILTIVKMRGEEVRTQKKKKTRLKGCVQNQRMPSLTDRLVHGERLM